jgi:DNA primase large subunit
MTEPNDIRSLLTSKSRVKVAPRDTSLVSKRSRSEANESSTPETDSSNKPETQASTEDLNGLQAELDNLPSIGKRLAIHLEQGVRAELVRLCDESDITPETFFEAAFVLLQDKPALLTEIVADAKVRLTKRKQAGLVRRTIAMVQKYSS